MPLFEKYLFVGSAERPGLDQAERSYIDFLPTSLLTLVEAWQEDRLIVAVWTAVYRCCLLLWVAGQGRAMIVPSLSRSIQALMDDLLLPLLMGMWMLAKSNAVLWPA